ncbi:MAG: hypothetical protein CR967_01990 [Proteobacteria bacterium]|nr:MAG: hypothetical protein CR967_01990 [Pseudomonadota bacterium]
MKTPLSNALSKIIKHSSTSLKKEFIPLIKARGRISAQLIHAKYNIPSHDISLRDGFVLKSDMLKKLPMQTDKLPQVQTGSRIDGDFVYIIEKERVKSKLINQDLLAKLPRAKEFIKPKGEDIQKGQILINKGDTINSFDVANLASQGISEVLVYEKIKIAYIGVNDSIVDLDQDLQNGQIYNSNAYAIATRGKVLGASVSEILHVKSNSGALKEKLMGLKNCHAIVTIGSMGKGDCVDTLLEDKDFNVIFKGVALAPGGLSGFSFLGSIPILHLPGLPLSAFLGFEVLGSTMINTLYGKRFAKHNAIKTFSLERIKTQSSSQSVIPGFFDGSFFKPFKAKPGMMNVLNNCNGYIITPLSSGIKEGDRVDFYPFLAWND